MRKKKKIQHMFEPCVPDNSGFRVLLFSAATRLKGVTQRGQMINNREENHFKANPGFPLNGNSEN